MVVLWTKARTKLGEGRDIGAMQELGATLQSTSIGGRQRFGCKAGTWSDFEKV